MWRQARGLKKEHELHHNCMQSYSSADPQTVEFFQKHPFGNIGSTDLHDMCWLHSRGGWLLSKVLIPSNTPPRRKATRSALIWCFKMVLGFLCSRRLNSLFGSEKRLQNNDFKSDLGDLADRLKTVCTAAVYVNVTIFFMFFYLIS